MGKNMGRTQKYAWVRRKYTFNTKCLQERTLLRDLGVVVRIIFYKNHGEWGGKSLFSLERLSTG